jgi:hypothetical protein
MLFSFIWDVYVVVDIIGHWLNVWQGSCQAKSSQWKSHYGAEERRIAKQVVGGMEFWEKGGFWREKRLVFGFNKCTEKFQCVMYFGSQKPSLGIEFEGL